MHTDRLPPPDAIGLASDQVAVRGYDTRWPAEYQRERSALLELLGDRVLEIEHIGSTAVPGLTAKPIIDIALGFPDRASLDQARSRLRAPGYDDRGDFGDRGGVIIAKGPETQQTHLLHLVLVESDQWRGFLAFRDALRADPLLREEYAALKSSLASRFSGNRESYLSGKVALIARVLAP